MPFPVLVEQFLENLRWNIQLLVGDEDRMFYRLQSEPDSYFRDLAYAMLRSWGDAWTVTRVLG